MQHGSNTRIPSHRGFEDNALALFDVELRIVCTVHIWGVGKALEGFVC